MKNIPSMDAMFDYLDELRDSGVTNMFGARPFLMEAFDLPAEAASDVLAEWMKTYSDRHPPKVRDLTERVEAGPEKGAKGVEPLFRLDVFVGRWKTVARQLTQENALAESTQYTRFKIIPEREGAS